MLRVTFPLTTAQHPSPLHPNLFIMSYVQLAERGVGGTDAQLFLKGCPRCNRPPPVYRIFNFLYKGYHLQNFVVKANLLSSLPCCVVRAGLSKCGARLEALLRGPIQWRVQNFLVGHHVIMIEIVDVRARGLGHDPQFHLSSRDFNDNAITPNKFMNYYTQYLQRGDIEGRATAHPELNRLQ